LREIIIYENINNQETSIHVRLFSQ